MFVSTAHGDAEIDALVEVAHDFPAADLGIWATIADEAGARAALGRRAPARDRARRHARLLDARPRPLRLGLESIYEGYLLHYGRPRLFAPADSDTAILLGDYLYAHGPVRVASHGEVGVVADLAELVSLCAQLRAEERDGDGAAWAGTVALLGTGDLRLENARARAADGRGSPSPRPRGARDRHRGGPAGARPPRRPRPLRSAPC